MYMWRTRAFKERLGAERGREKPGRQPGRTFDLPHPNRFPDYIDNFTRRPLDETSYVRVLCCNSI